MSQYNSHFSYWETFNQKKSEAPLLAWSKRFFVFWKWIILLFLVVTFFWGLGTLFFDEDIKTGEIEILNAEGEIKEKTFISGVFFELISGYKEELTFKNHVFHLSNGDIYEYDYKSATTVKEMWDYSEAPFYAIFVLPTSWLMNKIAFGLSWSENSLRLDKNLIVMIFTIFFTSLLLRLFIGAGTWKQQKSQMKMKKVQEKVNLIKEKYKDQDSAEAKQKSQWEIMSLYKKENVNPLSSALEGFAFAPFLFAMFVVVRTSRILKNSSTETFSFTTDIWKELSTNQNAIYLIPVLVYTLLFILDNFVLTRYIDKKTTVKKIVASNKKPKTSQIIFKWGFKVLFFVFFFIVPVGTSVYWIFSSFFEGLQKGALFQVQKKQKRTKILKKHGKEARWYGIPNFLKSKKTT